MSLFGSIMGMGDMMDDPFFGSHMRQMRHMNHMMNSLLADPFGMFGDMGRSPLAIGQGNSLMPFMPQMPMNRMYSASMSDMDSMRAGSSYSSSTVIMSSGPNGNPQVYSTSSSTKFGPNGVKETRKTLEDSRTGTKKMSVGHHIGERAHVIERAQNMYSGDREETQEYINLDEDEAEDFDREFQEKSGSYARHRGSSHRSLPAIAAPPLAAITAAPTTHNSEAKRPSRPAGRRSIRDNVQQQNSASVREVYSGSHPQRHRTKHHRPSRHSPQHE